MTIWLAKVFGTGFGTGYAPVASGTVGSLLAAAMYWFIPNFARTDILLSVSLVMFAVGVWSGGVLEDLYGHDPREATIDELVGQWLALAFLPKTWLTLLLSVALFRLFDITKPEPANKFQKLPRGWGVMMDDVVAGVYANLAVQLIYLLMPQWK
ncbi:MAG: phosphatidylglycerophosphatase A [Rhizobacter sp.]|nr:phosphatidylglycerophosphatase A [Chlorobiales bacterium]